MKIIIVVFILIISLFLLASLTIHAKEETTLYLGSLESSYNERGDLVSSKVSLGAGTATIVRNTNYQTKETSISYLYPDHLSSTVLIDTYGSSGGKRTTLSYYPYGNTREAKDTKEDRLYTGQRKDTLSSLYFYNARYYNSTSSHFISADKAEGPNRYVYVFNNPIMMNDPTGNDAGFGGQQTHYRDQENITKKDLFMYKQSAKVMLKTPVLRELLDLGMSTVGIVLSPISLAQNINISQKDLDSKEVKDLFSKIDSEVGNLEDYDDSIIYLDKVANSFKNNLVFNQGVEKAINENNSDIMKGLQALYIAKFANIYFGNNSARNIIKDESGKCFEFAGLAHTYLGLKGIETKIVGSEDFFHTFLSAKSDSGTSIVIDPSHGFATTEATHRYLFGNVPSNYRTSEGQSLFTDKFTIGSDGNPRLSNITYKGLRYGWVPD